MPLATADGPRSLPLLRILIGWAASWAPGFTEAAACTEVGGGEARAERLGRDADLQAQFLEPLYGGSGKAAEAARGLLGLRRG